MSALLNTTASGEIYRLTCHLSAMGGSHQQPAIRPITIAKDFAGVISAVVHNSAIAHPKLRHWGVAQFLAQVPPPPPSARSNALTASVGDASGSLLRTPENWFIIYWGSRCPQLEYWRFRLSSSRRIRHAPSRVCRSKPSVTGGRPCLTYPRRPARSLGSPLQMWWDWRSRSS